MRSWWEIYADERGGLMVEHFRGPGWVFEPTKAGRPRRNSLAADAIVEMKGALASVLPPEIQIDRWAVV